MNFRQTLLVCVSMFQNGTGNVTGHHQGPKHHHYNARPMCAFCYYVSQVLFFIVELWSRAFSLPMHVLCVYSTFGHHPHPLVYPCAKIRLSCPQR